MSDYRIEAATKEEWAERALRAEAKLAKAAEALATIIDNNDSSMFVQDQTIEFRPSTSNAILRMVDRGEISYAGAKEVYRVICDEGGDPADIVARLGLMLSMTEADISAAIDKVLHDNPEQAETARTSPKVEGWIVGQAIKALKGKADPKDIAALVAQKLKE